MSDSDAIYALMVERGPVGVHTLELRRRGYSGNPSQRATDIERKFGVTIHREQEVDEQSGRRGSRYRIVGIGTDGLEDPWGPGSYPPVSADSGVADSEAPPPTTSEAPPRPLSLFEESSYDRLSDAA